MNILVTGGCGFIGTHLVRRLVELGHQITVIDDLSGPQHTHALPKYFEGVQYARHHLQDYGQIYQHFKEVDCVFHMAAEARIQNTIDNPHYASAVNISGTISVLEACRVHKVPKFINSSTSAVYGLTEQFPTHEDVPQDCLNPYSATKAAAEIMISCYSRLYDLDSYSFRYFNVFGENSPVHGPYSLVVGIFLEQFNKKQPLTVVGDGSAKRDFVYVGDVVEANILAMQSKPDTGHKIFNIGSGENTSILDIAHSLSSDIEYLEPRIGEAKTTLCDYSKAKYELGWKPKTMLTKWLSKQQSIYAETHSDC
jgi:UDP-glucose 4-epimerase